MGGGTYNTSASTARVAAARNAGTDLFAHTRAVRAGTAPTLHEDLDPKRKNNAGIKEGSITRTCEDGDDHPNALPVMVFFDVTGSMGSIPKTLREKLPELQGLIQRKGYAEDPQICFGAIGDHVSDRAPLQVSQFESDERMDSHLENIYLEGNGGGGCHESYGLAAYFADKFTYTDAWTKRGKKGFLFIMGDERPWDIVTKDSLVKLLGDEVAEEADLSVQEVFARVQERWHTFFLFVKQGSYSEAQALDNEWGAGYGRGGWVSPGGIGWREVGLGENILILDDAEDVCNTIATTIGLVEGTLTHDRINDDLAEIGASDRSRRNVSTALARVAPGSNIAIPTAIGTLPDVHEQPLDDGTERL